ncbi:SIS domain-containing protein [uncultured Pseudokineococcus sp.]|uniref:SIS domain-containing protein n=1 Tax=uncultured Pseudokineococcus sp. TaxID=1642928 RepID=UPI002603D098|nr:SIS domain-containing protein [uncultured Pseudokineococcus sp.]
MPSETPARSSARDLEDEVVGRLRRLTELAADGGLDEAIALVADCVASGGVVHAFGTGHSEAFAMEVAGRAGGLMPTNRVALRDAVLLGDHEIDELYGRPPLERDPAIAEDLFATIPRQDGDLFVIASNSGVNGSVVGVALLAKQHGHRVVAVTSLAHTAAVEPKHPSGKRLSEVADVVLDNLAPYGDATLTSVGDIAVGAVSSLTSAYLAQLLTVGAAELLAARGQEAPLYVSANIPGGDDHNHELEARYGDRIRRGA